jgi:hypothetical protein
LRISGVQNQQRGLVDQNSASWNRVFSWLNFVEQLRQRCRTTGRISAVLE